MSVAIVIESFGGGGAQHVASTLANHWTAAGHTVTAITFSTPESDAFKLDPRVRRIVVDGGGVSANTIAGLFANIRRVRALRRAIRASGAQTVLSFVGSMNVLAVLASFGLRKRVIVSERNDPARQSLGRAWDALRTLFYPRADLVIANSQAAIETMKAYVPSERLLWLPNPLRRAPQTSKTLDPHNPFFLAVGRLDAQKAYDILLTAFADVLRGRGDLNLVILGDGPLRTQLEVQAQQLDIADKVSFAGRVGDPFPWYRSATALAHPARFEGMPNAVLEAMSEGLAVIVSDAQEGLRGIVEDGKSGLVVAAGSAQSLAEAMRKMLHEPELRHRLAVAGRQSVEAHLAGALEKWTDAVLAKSGGRDCPSEATQV